MDMMPYGAMMCIALAFALVGCASEPDRALGGNPSLGAEIGADSSERATAEIDPCLLALDNPVWRDHGGLLAYKRRCGHAPGQ